jgi:hypothetical protein
MERDDGTTNDELVRALRSAADILERQRPVIDAARAINEHTFKRGKVQVDDADRAARMDALKRLE